MQTKTYYVYILANRHRTIYTGVTNNMVRRLSEHRARRVPGFTARYGLDRLVYCESTSDIRAAIQREKEIKRWVRRKKVALIETTNPYWQDLAEGLFQNADPSPRSR
jgi:putative endonuclease